MAKYNSCEDTITFMFNIHDGELPCVQASRESLVSQAKC